MVSSNYINDITVWNVWALILGRVSNKIPQLGPAVILTLSLGLVPNAFSDSLFINLLCAHAVF